MHNLDILFVYLFLFILVCIYADLKKRLTNPFLLSAPSIFSSSLGLGFFVFFVRATYLLTVLSALSSVPSQAADCSRCAAL